MDILKQILELRELLKSADLEDESREAAERNLNSLEEAYKQAQEAQEAEEATPVEAAPQEEAREVDFTPLIDAFQEVGRNIVDGQQAINEKLDEVLAAREVAEQEAEEEVEASTEERSANTEVINSLTEKMDNLRSLIESSVPQRRGVGPVESETEPVLDEAARLVRSLEDIEDPEARLRQIFGVAEGKIEV
jgi:hypothetical protein